MLLAEELGLGPEEQSQLRTASLLHDLGKLSLSGEIVDKPGPLSEGEWSQMRGHPAAAMRLLSEVLEIANATPAILHHHEHFDGSGYPEGLAGNGIPIAARVIMVCDAYDAMTNDRPYREAMAPSEAIEELRRNSGTQFDPEVVEAFLTVLARRGSERIAAKSA